MPLRIISYDGASYKQELLDKKLKQKYPVATLVLYFGTETKWTAPKKLCECFTIPGKLKPFVSDYKINVFNIAWLSDKTISMFKSDFKFVAKYFQAKRKNQKYKPTNEEIKHVDSLLKMFSALTGDNKFEKVYNEGIKTKGGVTMCEIVQGFINEGIKKGKAQGKAEEKAELIRRMLDENFATPQQIAGLLKISVREVNKLASKVPAEA